MFWFSNSPIKQNNAYKHSIDHALFHCFLQNFMKGYITQPSWIHRHFRENLKEPFVLICLYLWDGQHVKWISHNSHSNCSEFTMPLICYLVLTAKIHRVKIKEHFLAFKACFLALYIYTYLCTIIKKIKVILASS